MKRYDAELGVFGDLKIVERTDGDWVKWDDAAKLEEAHTEIMNHLKSWLSMVRPVTGKETYYITNEFMEDICAAYNSAASKTGRDPI